MLRLSWGFIFVLSLQWGLAAEEEQWDEDSNVIQTELEPELQDEKKEERDPLCQAKWPEISKKFEKYVELCHEPLDWKKLFSSPERVFYLGDMHVSQGIRKEIMAHLDEIKAAGISIWAEELSVECNEVFYEFLCRKPEGEKGMKKIMDNTECPKANMDLITAVRDGGFKIVATDTQDRYSRTVKAMNSRIKNFGCYSKEKSPGCIGGRDCFMVKNINFVLNQAPDSRIVAFFGANHGDADYQPAHLKKLKVDSKSYFWAKYVDYMGPAEGVFLKGSLLNLHNDLMKKKHFFLPLPKESMPEKLRFDGLISTPEIWEEEVFGNSGVTMSPD